MNPSGVLSISRLRINRNILECKGNFFICCFGVNFVLIETYWNVKVTTPPAVNTVQRINRNILECKVRCSHIAAGCTAPVLIETYWNVKLSLISAITLRSEY